MVDFTHEDTFRAWLEGRPLKDSVLIAARAVLRALPIVREELWRKTERNRALIVLPVFRAAAIAHVVGISESQIPLDRKIYLAARLDVAEAAKIAIDGHVRNFADSVGRAVIAADSAARGAPTIDFVPDATARAAETAENAGASDRSSFRAFGFDAESLQEGATRHMLGVAPLWRDGPPSAIMQTWKEVRRILLDADEGWEVWVDWYEARLHGEAADEKLEIAKAKITNEKWEAGPATLNAEIATLIAKHGISGPGAQVGPEASPALKQESTEPSPTAGETASTRPKKSAPPVATADAIPTVAFFSYTRRDDGHTNGLFSKIRRVLEDRIEFLHGSPLEVFQDKEDIAGGDIWRERLERALVEATIFVPMVTPRFFKSPHCQEELSRFLARDDGATFVLPIHFADTDFSASAARDELKARIEERQWLDWRKHNGRQTITQGLRNDIHEAAHLIFTRWQEERR